MRAVRTMLQYVRNISVTYIYMKRTYFLFGINNYILQLQWASFILTFYYNNLNKLMQAIHTKEMKYDRGDCFIFWYIHICWTKNYET